MQLIANTEASLLEALSIISPSSSKTTLRSWLKEGRVTLDGEVNKRADAPLVKGQKIVVGAKAQFIANKIRIIYEDPHLIAIEKPSGMLSVATAFEKGITAHALLKKHFHPRNVYVVHRLDQDTSGVMLFALSDQGYRGLKALFKDHSIERRYCAIIEGNITPLSGTWQSYLYEDANYMVHSSQNAEKGIVATTHYQVLKTTPRYTRIEFRLETGRKNQIRVHCGEHGHPVVGDKKYGASSDPLHRLCLHAQTLFFQHPILDKKIRLISPIPTAFDRLVKDPHA